MNNKKTRLQRFISSSIAVLLFAAIALGAALPAAASTAASFTADFAKTQTGRAADNLRSNDEREFSSGIPMDANGIPMTADGVPKLKRDVRRSVNSDFSFINVSCPSEKRQVFALSFAAHIMLRKICVLLSAAKAPPAQLPSPLKTVKLRSARAVRPFIGVPK